MDPEKKFIQVETAFFWRWWRQQDEETQDTVKKLVDQGQLQFAGGGWSMNDEGASHYAAIIDQMSLGLRILNDTFGDCGAPKVAWQIDPFGHSKEQASIFSNLGFDGLFFARLDYRDKMKRKEEKTMEMVWEASQDIGDASDLFTGVLYNEYGPPPGFCWDLPCDDAPLMDNDLFETNIDERADALVNFIREQSVHYRTNHIILTMGEDFQYQAAHSWFMNLDRMLKHFNLRKEELKINMFYSTPACYLNALHAANLTWPTKQDDFMPYASDPHSYWAGYFSSRPSSKYMMRQAERYSQIHDQLTVLLDKPPQNAELLHEAVAIVQHHDAITGTEKQHVANNYHKRLHDAVQDSFESLDITPVYETDLDDITLCPLMNISQCPTTENIQTSLTVQVYNPLPRSRSHNVRIPVEDLGFVVTDEGGLAIESQIVAISEQILMIPGRISKATHELIFNAIDIPSYGAKKFVVERKAKLSQKKDILENQNIYTLGDTKFNVTFDVKNKKYLISNGNKNFSKSLTNELRYYQGHRGSNDKPENRASGAYIFRPDGDFTIPVDNITYSVLTKGPLVDELHITYEDGWLSQIARIYHGDGEDVMEMEWVVGPIPVDDGVGKEIIALYCTDIQSNGLFYTDSNGRQMMKRVRNSRPTYEIDSLEPTAQNYYPVNSQIFIKDDSTQLGVLVDRSQGGSSLQDGCVELMLHRRLLDDDAFGVGEALNENAYGTGLVTVGKHLVVLGQDTTEKRKEMSLDLFYKPLIVFQKNADQNVFPQLDINLPANVHILTLRKILLPEEPDATFVLLRLEHIYQVGEHPDLSTPATVSLSALFSGVFSVEWARETLLGGNVWTDEAERLEWSKEDGEEGTKREEGKSREERDLEVTIMPMEIRTFILKIVY